MNQNSMLSVTGMKRSQGVEQRWDRKCGRWFRTWVLDKEPTWLWILPIGTAIGTYCLVILLLRVKRQSEKAGLKLSIWKTKIMVSGPITSWQTEGEKVEVVTYFILLGSKITADGDCSHEIKRCLVLERKAMINLDSILKSRDTTLSTKVHVVKAMVSFVVMYGCESWNIKKAEHQRIDAFKLWCWRRFLRVRWTARRSN